MSAQAVARAIDAVVDELYALGVAVESSKTVVLRLNEGIYRVTWDSKRASGFELYDRPTLDDYRRILEGRQYSVLLKDGAILQISYDVSTVGIVGHRLCFFPCPIPMSDEDVREFGPLEYIELMGLEEVRSKLSLESPIRFDFAPESATPVHPASHVTIGRSSCRLPVFAPLSLQRFVEFVFSNFYLEIWQSAEKLKGLGPWKAERTLDQAHRSVIHLECHDM